MGYTKREIQMGTAKTFPLMIKFSIPTIVGMIVTSLNMFLDRIFVGNMPSGEGDMAIAGINFSSSMLAVVFAIAMWFAMGGGANISLSLGANKRKDAEKFMGASLMLGIVVGLVFCELGALLNVQILQATGVSETLLPYASSYLSIMLTGYPLFILGFIMSRFIMAQGFPKLAMLSNILTVVVNAALDPLFIFIFDMGIEGAAWATVIAQSIPFFWYGAIFMLKKMPLKIRLKNLKPRAYFIKRILKVGMASGLMQVGTAVVQFLVNFLLVTTSGDAGVTTMGIVLAIVNLIYMPIYGINQGVQPILGFNYGAKQYSRVRKLLTQAIFFTTAVSVVLWIFSRIFSNELVGAFGSSGEVWELSTYALDITLIILPLTAFQIISGAYFQSTSRPLKAIFVMTMRQILLFIPVVFTLSHFWGFDGIVYTTPICDALSIVITSIIMVFELRKLGKLKDVPVNFKA